MVVGEPVQHPQTRQAQSSETEKNKIIPKVSQIADFFQLECMNSEKDTYIVRLISDSEGGSPTKRQDHIDHIWALCKKDKTGTFAGIEVRFERCFQAYAGHFGPDVIAAIEKEKERGIVTSISKNGAGVALSRESPNWGLSRVSLTDKEWTEMLDEKKANHNQPWIYKCGKDLGKGVQIYILDVELFRNTDYRKSFHRLRVASNGYGMGKSTSHGTIVANIAAGETCGMAPEASVFLFNPSKITLCTMMTGMEKILDQEHSLNQPHYSVLNCSWYLPASVDSSGMLSQMFRKAISQGIYVIAAAGNNGGFLGNTNPNWVPQCLEDVIMVGASDSNNEKCGFSNYGPGVAVYAPGSDPVVLEGGMMPGGTSASAPHVTGLLACLLSSELLRNEERKILSAAEMKETLKDCFSREQKDYLGQPLRTIFFNGERPNVTEMSIVHVDDHFIVTLPPDGIERALTPDILKLLFTELQDLQFKAIDELLEQEFQIKNGATMCLKATKSVRIGVKPNHQTNVVPDKRLRRLMDPTTAIEVGEWVFNRLGIPFKKCAQGLDNHVHNS